MFLNRFNTVQKEAVAWAGPRRPPGPFNLFNPVTVLLYHILYGELECDLTNVAETRGG
ncbi:unnamed protein product [Penicillium camemberti]|uniref:Str. FM013 n=1 Tax=Penicillium camemberti (strain FM 013) TaxID=1429867 RepID=A0A0G4PLK4_PENC3|nr:unnamed protein product [Penicillium camemberti]